MMFSFFFLLISPDYTNYMIQVGIENIVMVDNDREETMRKIVSSSDWRVLNHSECLPRFTLKLFMIMTIMMMMMLMFSTGTTTVIGSDLLMVKDR